MFDSIVKVVLAIALIVVLVAIGPWLVIWSLNTLFPVLAIEFTFWTWFAVVIMGTFFRANVTIKRKD
jgi:heme A synthase